MAIIDIQTDLLFIHGNFNKLKQKKEKRCLSEKQSFGVFYLEVIYQVLSARKAL